MVTAMTDDRFLKEQIFDLCRTADAAAAEADAALNLRARRNDRAEAETHPEPTVSSEIAGIGDRQINFQFRNLIGLREARQTRQAHVDDEALLQLVAIIGEECGRVDAALQRQIDQQRDEIAALRAEIEVLRGVIRGNVTEIGNRHVA